jgi:hypothetical protein
VAIRPGPGSLLRRRVLQAWRLKAAHGDDLLPLPDPENEGVASPAENGVGSIIEGLKRKNHAAAPGPDEGGAEEISQELAQQLVTQIVPGQRKSTSTRNFFFF